MLPAFTCRWRATIAIDANVEKYSTPCSSQRDFRRILRTKPSGLCDGIRQSLAAKLPADNDELRARITDIPVWATNASVAGPAKIVLNITRTDFYEPKPR
jgi:hypothetical protein